MAGIDGLNLHRRELGRAAFEFPGNLDWSFHEARLTELEAQLDQAFANSPLPQDRDRKAISQFLVRLRLGD